MTIDITALTDYTAWERGLWGSAFSKHPEALNLSAGPNGDGRFSTVGDLVKHIFSAEKRYVQRLRGQPLSDYSAMPSDDAQALFALGDESRQDFERLLAEMPQEEWDVSRELQILNWRVKITPRKIVMHTLMHESRHWAQIATLWRLNGLPVAFHDLLGSPAMGGEFR